MLPTAGFIPPPVAPVLPAAVSSIVPTGGKLAAAAAAAAAGAKVGSVLGPKGALAGAVAGALLLPLLLPQPTAPGTLPPLDPGLNKGPSPAPKIIYPKSKLTAGDPSPDAPVQYFNGSYQHCTSGAENYRCSDGSGPDNWITPPSCFSPANWAFTGKSVEVDTQFFESGSSCTATGYKDSYTARVTGIKEDGTSVIVKQQTARDGTWYTGTGVEGQQAIVYAKILSFNADGVPQPIPDQEPRPEEPTPKPRPLPVPIRPITDPNDPAPAPRIVPRPDPEPQPEPLTVPSPDTPKAPPITIPKAPPAPPVEVPGPEPKPLPVPTPVTPTPVAPPLPVPGVPTIPEPSPDPQPVPAPGPAPNPLPVPQPDPLPDTEPLPGTTPVPNPLPTPITPITPGPGPITTPITPEEPQLVDPEIGPVPVPDPPPTITPPDGHYPVPGGPVVTPGGTRPELASIAAEVGRIEQKVARIQNPGGIGDLTDLVQLLLTLLSFFESPISGTTYQLEGVCEDVKEGEEQPVAEFPVPEAYNFDAIVQRLDAMQDLFQQHLAYRTPICRGQKRQGDLRTISFISDEVSPNGHDRIAKRFRYRSQSGTDLGGLIDHWRNFVWQAGPVIVEHTDGWWGSIKVWASSIDEGKRVIRHAAGEAGINPDQVGRWAVSGSTNSRYGMPGTMRVNQKGGYWWITARDGASPRPEVGSDSPDI